MRVDAELVSIGEMSDDVNFNKANIVVYSIVGILHFIGLILLSLSKSDLPNQRLLMINLAVAEISFCLTRVVSCSVELREDASEDLIEHILDEFCTTLFAIEIRLTMLHVIFDRFLEIITNIKYPMYMTHKRMLMVIVIHWLISLGSATTSFSLRSISSRRMQFTFFMKLILDVIILISAIATYLYFYKIVCKVRATEARTAGQPEESGITLLLTKFKLPCYIILTYICFNLASTILLVTSRYMSSDKQKEILFEFSHVPMMIGIFSDAILYVFANKNVRDLLWHVFRKRSINVL